MKRFAISDLRFSIADALAFVVFALVVVPAVAVLCAAELKRRLT